MKILFFLCCLLSALPLAAENILILHGQDLPPESTANFKNDTNNIILEAVFAQAFDKNHIAFDSILESPDALPDRTEIIQSAKKYGGDKVISFVLSWKKGKKGTLVFDHLDYNMSLQNGKVLAQGKLEAQFEALAPDEIQNANDLAQKLTGKINPLY